MDLPDASRELVSTATTQSNGRFAPGSSRAFAGVDLVYRYNNKLSASNAISIRGSFRRSRSQEEASRMASRPYSSAGFRGRTPKDGLLPCRLGSAASGGPSSSSGPILTVVRGKYRFTQTAVVRYMFRALVKRQGGYPYEPGGSPKRKLTFRVKARHEPGEALAQRWADFPLNPRRGRATPPSLRDTQARVHMRPFVPSPRALRSTTPFGCEPLRRALTLSTKSPAGGIARLLRQGATAVSPLDVPSNGAGH